MAAGGRAPLPGLSPVRGQSAGTAASARVTQSLPPPRPSERALQRRTRPGSQERGQSPRLGSSAGRQRAVPSGQDKSSNSSHLCQKLWCLSSQRQEASAAGVCAGGLWSCPCCGSAGTRGNVVPELWPIRLRFPLGKQNSLWAEEKTSQQRQIAMEARVVFGAGSAESCVCLCCHSLTTGTWNSLGKGIGGISDAPVRRTQTHSHSA
ncbi:uncharacterized protein LOC115903710 [Camarhynchus parvulus]|uniref:uncharacterized protein LOC115903710 n=1 Tax=Geospiza parvula TaxID=87175 RepID=UPI001237B38F|nr:uncharacterized protein LOC115903710 [Camarhynchus parvulus]